MTVWRLPQPSISHAPAWLLGVAAVFLLLAGGFVADSIAGVLVGLAACLRC